MVPGFDHMVPGFEHMVTGFDHMVQGFDHMVTDFDHMVPGFDHMVPGFAHGWRWDSLLTLTYSLHRALHNFRAFHPDMNLIMRKPVFGVFDQVRLKQVFSTIEAS